MFTGIVETVGHIVQVEERGGDRHFRIAAPGLLQGAQPGDSIAVDGVCLTAVSLTGDHFTTDVSRETLSLTTASRWAVGTRVNLERALTPAKPLGGHLVSGHVDGLARLIAREPEARSWRLRFEAPATLARYIARKGSVTLDGISLTVNEVEGVVFGVNVIPQTWTHTTLGERQVGDAVNLEVDLIARYLERLLTAREAP